MIAKVKKGVTYEASSTVKKLKATVSRIPHPKKIFKVTGKVEEAKKAV